mmetsp:Transcript_49146/g.59572  ORF Transcript_49146/g.59572 Transcript_49146/m.59572 type:complete len:166 (+) Transcript_49146:75-572(+)
MSGPRFLILLGLLCLTDSMSMKTTLKAASPSYYRAATSSMSRNSNNSIKSETRTSKGTTSGMKTSTRSSQRGAAKNRLSAPRKSRTNNVDVASSDLSGTEGAAEVLRIVGPIRSSKLSRGSYSSSAGKTGAMKYSGTGKATMKYGMSLRSNVVSLSDEDVVFKRL